MGKQIELDAAPERLRATMADESDAGTVLTSLIRYAKHMEMAVVSKKRADEKARNLRGALLETLKGISGLRGDPQDIDRIEGVISTLQAIDENDREIREARELAATELEAAQADFDAIMTQAFDGDAHDAARLQKLQQAELAYQTLEEARAGRAAMMLAPKQIRSQLRKRLKDELSAIAQEELDLDSDLATFTN